MNQTRRVAVVTGSSAGVGRATAIGFAARNCNVVINYHRSAEEAGQVSNACRELGAEAAVVRADVSTDAACRELVQAALDAFGRIDYLVNNAAVTEFVEFSNLDGLTEEIWERIFRTNVFGAFFCSRAAAPSLKRSGNGSIVNVASIAGILSLGSSIAYAASKAAMINMTQALARTLGPDIRVNAVAPGAIDTRWLRQGMGEAGFTALRESLKTTSPLQRVATAEDVAEAVIWLAESASMTTGEVLTIDGGFLLGRGAGVHPRPDRQSP